LPTESGWARRLLSAHDAALVLTDYGDAVPRLEVTASFTYVRIHSEDEAMNSWAERLGLSGGGAGDVGEQALLS
jgi:hypothetical protein